MKNKSEFIEFEQEMKSLIIKYQNLRVGCIAVTGNDKEGRTLFVSNIEIDDLISCLELVKKDINKEQNEPT
jgi:hypothetical protein